MTTHIDPVPQNPPPATPSQQVTAWLERFGEALDSRSSGAVVRLFEHGGFWRDLISFTWNITTLEGRPAIADMLAAQLSGVNPSGWTLEGEASEQGGVVDGWFTFETEAARGRGHLRLKGGLCWTLLKIGRASCRERV